MNKEQIYLSENGLKKLKEEIKKIEQEQQPAAIQELATAREHGDLSENAEYKAARDECARLENKLAELKEAVATAKVIKAEHDDDIVRFGATVKLEDEDTGEIIVYHIAGQYEADISKNIISIMAPISRALISKQSGDSVTVGTPAGSKVYKILDVYYKKDKELDA